MGREQSHQSMDSKQAMPVGDQSSTEVENTEPQLQDFLWTAKELGYLSTAVRHLGVGGLILSYFYLLETGSPDTSPLPINPLAKESPQQKNTTTW